jgi:hypothetical protein
MYFVLFTEFVIERPCYFLFMEVDGDTENPNEEHIQLVR